MARLHPALPARAGLCALALLTALGAGVGVAAAQQHTDRRPAVLASSCGSNPADWNSIVTTGVVSCQ